MPEQTIQALDELTRRGFGTAEFLVDEAGNLIHTETVFTAQLERGESLADFIARAKIEGIWQYGDRIQIPQFGICPPQRVVNDRHNPLDVRSRGNLWHHSGKSLMKLVLRGHDRRQNLQLVGDNRRRRFVTRRFDRQNLHFCSIAANFEDG